MNLLHRNFIGQNILHMQVPDITDFLCTAKIRMIQYVIIVVTVIVVILWRLTRPFHAKRADSPSGWDAFKLRVFAVGMSYFTIKSRWLLSYFTGSCIYESGNKIPCKPKPKIVADGVDVFYFNKKDSEKQNCFIFMHGGAFVLPHFYSYDECLQYIAKRTDYLILSIDYRLAPKHIYPAAHDDCYKAVRYILSNPSEFNINENGIVMCGDSAGGNLVAWTSLCIAENDPHLSHMIEKQILLSPLIQCADFSLPSYEDTVNYFTYLSPKFLSEIVSVYLTGTDKYFEIFYNNKLAGMLHSCDVDVIRKSCDVPKDVMDQILAPIVASLLTRTYPSSYPITYMLSCEFDALVSEHEMFHKRLLDQGFKSTFINYKATHCGFLFARIGRPEDVRMLKDIIRIVNS